MRKPTIWVPTRSDINQTVQSLKQARSLKFRILAEEEVYYLCSGYREADLRLCFRIIMQIVSFAHVAASGGSIINEIFCYFHTSCCNI